MGDHVTDDLVKLHCFAAFVVSTTEARDRKTWILRVQADVRRFDVKDSISVLST